MCSGDPVRRPDGARTHPADVRLSPSVVSPVLGAHQMILPQQQQQHAGHDHDYAHVHAQGHAQDRGQRQVPPNANMIKATLDSSAPVPAASAPSSKSTPSPHAGSGSVEQKLIEAVAMEVQKQQQQQQDAQATHTPLQTPQRRTGRRRGASSQDMSLDHPPARFQPASPLGAFQHQQQATQNQQQTSHSPWDLSDPSADFFTPTTTTPHDERSHSQQHQSQQRHYPQQQQQQPLPQESSEPYQHLPHAHDQSHAHSYSHSYSQPHSAPQSHAHSNAHSQSQTQSQQPQHQYASSVTAMPVSTLRLDDARQREEQSHQHHYHQQQQQQHTYYHHYPQQDQNQHHLHHQQLSMSIRRAAVGGLESPIGLMHQQHLPAVTSNTNSSAGPQERAGVNSSSLYNRDPDELRAMLATREEACSQSPTAKHAYSLSPPSTSALPTTTSTDAAAAPSACSSRARMSRMLPAGEVPPAASASSVSRSAPAPASANSSSGSGGRGGSGQGSQRSPRRSAQMVAPSSSPGALLHSRSRTSKPNSPPDAMARAALAPQNAHVHVRSHTHSLGQMALAMSSSSSTPPALQQQNNGGSPIMDASASLPKGASHHQQLLPHHIAAGSVGGRRGSGARGGASSTGAGSSSGGISQSQSKLLVPVPPGYRDSVIFTGAPHGRQLSSGTMGHPHGGAGSGVPLRSVSPSGSISSSQHSRAVSSQSSVLSSFSSRHHHMSDSSVGSSAYATTDISIDGGAGGGRTSASNTSMSASASRACSTPDTDDVLSMHSGSIDVDSAGAGASHFSSVSLSSAAAAAAAAQKRSKSKIDDADRKRICEYAAAHPRQRQGDIAAVFDIERSTVSKILKNRDKWLAIDLGDVYLNRDRSIKYPDIERRLLDWVHGELESGSMPGDEQLREQAIAFARQTAAGVGGGGGNAAANHEFRPTDSWIETFKIRAKLPTRLDASVEAVSQSQSQTQSQSQSQTPSETSTTPAVDARGGSFMASTGPSTAPSPFAWNGASSSHNASVSSTASSLSELGLGLALQDARSHSSDPSDSAMSSSATSQATPRSVQRFTNVITGDGHSDIYCRSHEGRVNEHQQLQQPGLARSFSSTEISDTQLFSMPAKRRKGLSGRAVSPTVTESVSMDRGAVASPRAASGRARQEAPRRQRDQEETLSGALQLDLRGIDSMTPRHQGIAQVSGISASLHDPVPATASVPLHMHAPAPAPTSGTTLDGATMLSSNAERLVNARPLAGDFMETSSPAQTGSTEEGRPISVDEARESLDLVLRFLREQPVDFCPRDHFLVFGHLQGSLAALPSDMRSDRSRSGTIEGG